MTMKIDQKTQIAHSCANLILGETTRKVQCPFCLHANGDFSVTLTDEGLLYRCFRASCSKAGLIVVNPGEWTERKTKASPNTHAKYPYEGNLVSIRTPEWKFLKDNFNLTMGDIKHNNIKWCPITKRVLYGLKSYTGRNIGWVARVYKELNNNESIYPKAQTFWTDKDDDIPSVGFPYTATQSLKDGIPIYVLVEDIVSAIRIARYIPSIALLSTNIPANALDFLIDKHIIIALDEDATKKAIQLQQEYSLFFKSCHVVPLECDPKDMSETDLINCIIHKVRM